MRWERLFNELEAQAGDLEMQHRDALVDELRDGEWAETSWRSCLGGRVEIDVLGAGRIAGDAVLVNEQVIQLSNERFDHFVSASAVIAVASAERRAEPGSTVTASLGWRHVFRTLRDEAEPVRVQLVTGSTIDGTVAVIGADFVRIREESGRTQSPTFSAVAVVTGRR